jgi:DNA-binding transcriptional regulator YdaS (Cro superfamily)
MEQHQGIIAAIEAAGSQENLAAKLGVSQQLISRWATRGWVPPHRALEIEATLGVPRMRLVHPRLVDLLTPADFERVA